MTRQIGLSEKSRTQMRIAEALRRIRQNLTQTAASKRQGTPDFRTISHWETRHKVSSLRLLHRYLKSLGLDFHDLQAALDQVEGAVPKRLKDGLERLERRVGALEERICRLEAAGAPSPERPYKATG